MDHVQRIGMAARILDASSESTKAVSLLERVVEEAGEDGSTAELLEALVLLAEVYWYGDESERAREYLARAESVDLEHVGPDLVGYQLERLVELRQEINGTGL